jgi:hypothetical protein
MDLTQFLLQQAQALQKQLQGLLEKSGEPVPPPAPFEVTTDLSQLDTLGVGLPDDLNLRVPILFARLHPYFEAGILFSRKAAAWSPRSVFQRGFTFTLTSQDTKMEFEFPELTLTEVKKARSQVVINDLGLEDYLHNEKITALVFSPHPEFLFLVLSELADPWLKLQIDKIQYQTLLLLSDHV